MECGRPLEKVVSVQLSLCWDGRADWLVQEESIWWISWLREVIFLIDPRKTYKSNFFHALFSNKPPTMLYIKFKYQSPHFLITSCLNLFLTSNFDHPSTSVSSWSDCTINMIPSAVKGTYWILIYWFYVAALSSSRKNRIDFGLADWGLILNKLKTKLLMARIFDAVDEPSLTSDGIY